MSEPVSALDNVSHWVCARNRLIDIFFSVVAGVLTAIAIEAWYRTKQYWRYRRFGCIYGRKVREHKLVVGTLQASSFCKPPGYVKDPSRQLGITASAISSLCEMRALSYVSRSIADNSDLQSVVTWDEKLREALDVDFISFGAMSNLKSEDVFRNEANHLAEFSLAKGRFVKKTDQSVLYEPRPTFDHGIILKIHPHQFRKRTWIACAGYGEWGTSGAAYFLAHHWPELEQKLAKDHMFPWSDSSFVAVIEVELEKDESAKLVDFVKGR